MDKPKRPGDRMLAALTMHDLTPTERLIQIAIAYRDGRGGATPPIQEIADLVGLSRGTLFNHLKAIEAKGRARRERRQRSSLYVLDYASSALMSGKTRHLRSLMSEISHHLESPTSDVEKSPTSDVGESEAQMSGNPRHKFFSIWATII